MVRLAAWTQDSPHHTLPFHSQPVGSAGGASGRLDPGQPSPHPPLPQPAWWVSWWCVWPPGPRTALTTPSSSTASLVGQLVVRLAAWTQDSSHHTLSFHSQPGGSAGGASSRLDPGQPSPHPLLPQPAWWVSWWYVWPPGPRTALTTPSPSTASLVGQLVVRLATWTQDSSHHTLPFHSQPGGSAGGASRRLDPGQLSPHPPLLQPAWWVSWWCVWPPGPRTALTTPSPSTASLVRQLVVRIAAWTQDSSHHTLSFHSQPGGSAGGASGRLDPGQLSPHPLLPQPAWWVSWWCVWPPGPRRPDAPPADPPGWL